MSAIRASENRVEKSLRSALHRLGLRFRKYPRGLIGRPDIVFSRERVAVFVDGDYWHARILVEHGLDALVATLRTAQRDYWLLKFQRRVERDRHVTATLETEGWKVIRVWESDVKRAMKRTARQIAQVVRRRRGKP